MALSPDKASHKRYVKRFGPTSRRHGWRASARPKTLAKTAKADGGPPGPVPEADADELERTFAYDPLSRLVEATGRECDLPPECGASQEKRQRRLQRRRPLPKRQIKERGRSVRQWQD